VLPARTRRAGARLDIAGAVLATASVAFLIFGLSQGQQYGLANAAALAALALAVLLGVTFVIVQKRGKAPMVPLSVLPDPFGGFLTWGHLDNRPFFRALHGMALALWQLDL
jgi:hypothetical protein